MVTEKDFIEHINNKVPETTKDICLHLISIIEESQLFQERTFKWGAPTYEYKGLVCGVWGFKKHASLVVFNGALLKEFDPYFSTGDKNKTNRTIQFNNSNEIDNKLILKILQASIQLNEKGIKPPIEKKETTPLPDLLNQAFQKEPKAKDFYDSLSPSLKNEFNEHITSAKQVKTKIRRIEKCIALMLRGESLNQKYR